MSQAADERLPDDDDPRLVWPSPRRVATKHDGLAAVDFGTTNSTVTLYDATTSVRTPLAPSQCSVLRAELVGLLRSDPPTDTRPGRGPIAVDDWKQLVRSLACDVLGRLGATGADLVAAVLAEGGLGEDLLYTTLLRLEQRRPHYSQELACWIAYRLHLCYDRALRAVALDTKGLHIVKLDVTKGENELPSRLEIEGINPLTVRLGAELATAPAVSMDGSGEVHVVHSLKNHLSVPQVELERDGRLVTTDSLMAAAIGVLLERTDEFITATPAHFAPGRVNRVVLTYPTMAPPAVRQRLRHYVKRHLGVAHVDISYDEAVAAALFFLMRELGPGYSIGVEAMRARYRADVLAERQWVENVLVLDVGGGTTDIALITFRLQDATPPTVDRTDAFVGRYYRILPELRGSSGKARRGGDFVTLQVFHWIKAVLADRLLRLAPPQQPMPGLNLPLWQEWQAKTVGLTDQRFLFIPLSRFAFANKIAQIIEHLQ
jgi:hypothetical protein